MYFQLFPAKTPEEEDQVWLKLHNKYCDYVLDVVLHQRGVYIKLGQIASTRPDIIPKPYLKKFAQLQVKTSLPPQGYFCIYSIRMVYLPNPVNMLEK
jgi:predicted unusual protein kinase regulating ubiquinone biosynthesis (AarF/ABC1/UbiB family)